jgi:O-antigen ligase
MLQYDWDWDTVEPDMSYVRLLAETGLVGLGLNLAFYGGMSGFLWRRGRRLRALGRRSSAEFASAVLLTWAVFLIASAIQDTSLYLRTWLTFGLTICFARGGAVERWAEE